MDDEIDLRPYLSAILQRWWIILGTALGVAIIAGFIAWLRTPPYTASTSLLIIPASAQVTLDSRFTSRDSFLFTTTANQREALLGLARDPTLRKLPLVAVEVDGARQLLIERKVKSLLLASDAHHGERLFTLVANQLGIPSLVVQHGATLDDFGYVPLYATRFAAWGEISKQWLIARGVSPERIVITGSPRLDHLADNKKFGLTREDFCSQLSLPPSGLWVLWAMDPITKQENAAILKVLLDVVNRIEWCYLIIRPHPGSPQTAWISRFVNSQKHVVISSPEYPLYEILKAVDAVIIQDSTVGLEAMALDKPVIVLYPKGKPIGELYIQSGAVNVVTCVDELQHTLEHLYQNRALTVT
uniref:Wzz/FepE/Etk N-terminal domain-containing protein n=1 Tax=Chloroflexus sp. MS-G TaxID=1521187 RepID=UPI0004DF6B81